MLYLWMKQPDLIVIIICVSCVWPVDKDKKSKKTQKKPPKAVFSSDEDDKKFSSPDDGGDTRVV